MKTRTRWLLLLHIFLCIYAFGSVLSKWATFEDTLMKVLLMYCGVLLSMVIYAMGWQQVIKRISLTTAYANKAVTVVWGVIFGTLFFHEQVSLPKIIGVLVIICGVLLYVKADADMEEIE